MSQDPKIPARPSAPGKRNTPILGRQQDLRLGGVRSDDFRFGDSVHEALVELAANLVKEAVWIEVTDRPEWLFE